MSIMNLKLFALSSNQELAAKLLIKWVLNSENQVFVNFQMVRFQVNIEESIRGHHVLFFNLQAL